MFYLHFLRYDDGTFWYRGGTEKVCENRFRFTGHKLNFGKDSSTTF